MIASSGSSGFVESSYCDPPKTQESSNGVEQHDADCAAAAYRARALPNLLRLGVIHEGCRSQ